MFHQHPTRVQPLCGYSRMAVEELDKLRMAGGEKVAFDTFDVFADDFVSEVLKVFFEWPTFPQLYYKKELICGGDLLKEMADDGSLAEILSGRGTENV